jgi:hypothetical protein
VGYYEANKTVILANRRERYLQNRDSICEQRRLAYLRLTIAEKQELWRAARIRELWSRYHLTLGRYEDMLWKQENRCACCGREFNQSREMRPCVDHNHRCCSGPTSCGACIRALLCRWCNRLIGIIEKNSCLFAYLNKGEIK